MKKCLKNIFNKLKLLKLKIRISFKYRSYFLLNKKSVELAEKALASDPIVWDQEDDFLKLSICLLAITLTKMRSIYILCKNGLAKDAAIVLRVMFEDLVNFNYMHNDKKKVQDFMGYDSYQRLKLNKIITLDKSAKFDGVKVSEREAELRKEWDKIKYKYTFINRKGKEEIFTTWCGKNLEEMAKELKWEVNYNYIYRYLSRYVHLTPTTFNDYILGMKKNHVVVEVGESERLIPEILATANIIIVDALVKVINQEYSLGLDRQIVSLEEKIKNLSSKTMQKQRKEKINK